MVKILLCLAVLWGGLGSAYAAVGPADKAVVVFAAASLKNALDAANAAFTAATGQRTVVSYAATSALVRQIEQGAPAEILISADTQWMDHAVAKNLVRAETRVNLIGNRLVLIAPSSSPVGRVTINRNLDLAALAQNGRIAVADTRAVPAGKYAKAALEHFDLWRAVEPRLAMAENVRAALALAARGEAALGMVYASDAPVEPRVRIVGEFPAASHPPIVYPAALTVAASAAAARYLDFLRSAEAMAIFARFGFAPLS